MSREQWQAVSPLLAEAMELPESSREAWLVELDATQPVLAPLLRRLLAADRRAEQGRAFETASILLQAAHRGSSEWESGRRVGPYQLLRQLGRGGMGEVWLARPVEGGITRDVALKLPSLFGQASVWRERFRRERDILASLQHPNIATLFDAGVADLPGGGGQPYLAMESVQGTSLLDHATQRQLSLRERIALFRQVLAAVGGAHRQLVIHRDIKPANILVTAEGQAKLLDFGIAKLIEDDAATSPADDLTRLGGRMLTFRYAAPEQVLGHSLGTATDIYALGVVLHELLTEQSPYRRVRQGHAVGPGDFPQQDFALPSSLVSGGELVGDLDAIILKALRSDPAERYGTVEQFDDDLQRFLERRPVLARRGSRRYRVARFIARHRLPLAAAAAVLLSLITGLVLAERERRTAIAAQARAERHFASVRGLANAFIYDIDNQLRDVAGTLPARQLLVETSVKYLDRLAAEVNGDPALAAELAGGYRRMGEVLGSGTGANLGRWDEAIALFEKSAKLLDDIGDFGRNDETVVDDRQRVQYELAALYTLRGDPRWEAALKRSIDGSRALAKLRGNRGQDLLTVAVRLIELANTQSAEGRAGPAAYERLAEATSLLASAEQGLGNDDPARSTLAAGYLRLAEGLTATGRNAADFEAALAGARKSVQILDVRSQNRPSDTSSALTQTLAGGAIIEALVRLHRYADAEQQTRTVLQQLDNLGMRDSDDMEVAGNHWAALTVAMETAWLNGDPAAVLTRAGRSDELWRRLPDAVRSSEAISPFLAKRDYYRNLALLEGHAAQFAAACQQLRDLESRLPELPTSAPGESRDNARFSQLGPALARCSAADSGTSPN